MKWKKSIGIFAICLLIVGAIPMALADDDGRSDSERETSSNNQNFERENNDDVNERSETRTSDRNEDRENERNENKEDDDNWDLSSDFDEEYMVEEDIIELVYNESNFITGNYTELDLNHAKNTIYNENDIKTIDFDINNKERYLKNKLNDTDYETNQEVFNNENEQNEVSIITKIFSWFGFI